MQSTGNNTLRDINIFPIIQQQLTSNRYIATPSISPSNTTDSGKQNNESTTHFGFETVNESEKEKKGKTDLNHFN